MALHAHKAHTLPLLSNTHFSQARLVSFLTITVSPSLLAGVSTASVSFQRNCTTVKVKGTFLFSVSYSEWWGRLGMRGGGGEVQYQQMQLWNRTFGCRRGSRKPFCQSSKSIFSIIFFWKKKKKQGNSLSAAPVAWCWPWRYGTKWHDQMPRVPTLTLNFTSHSFHRVSKLGMGGGCKFISISLIFC